MHIQLGLEKNSCLVYIYIEEQIVQYIMKQKIVLIILFF